MNTISIEKINEDTGKFLDLMKKENAYIELVEEQQYINQDFKGTIEEVRALADSELKTKLINAIDECKKSAEVTGAVDSWLADALKRLEDKKNIKNRKV